MAVPTREAPRAEIRAPAAGQARPGCAGCGGERGVAPDVGALVVALVGDWLATPCCGGGAVQIEPSLCPPFVHFLSAKPEV